MKKRLAFALGMLIASTGAYPAQMIPPLRLIQVIHMPQVKCQQPNLSRQKLAQAVSTERMPSISCHFDRFGLDMKGHRLFVVPEDNGTVEVYGIPSGKFLHSIRGFGMAHNVVYRWRRRLAANI